MNNYSVPEGMANKTTRLYAICNRILLFDLSAFIITCPFSKKISKVFLIFLICLWFSMGILNVRNFFIRRLDELWAKICNPVLIFFGAAVISVLFSLHPLYSQKFLFSRYLFYFVIFFIGYELAKDRKSLILLTGSILMSSLIIGLGCVWDKFFLKPEHLFTSFGKNINVTNFLALYMPLLFSFMIFSRNKIMRITGAIALILMLVPLVFVFSRITWLACVFALLLVSCLKNAKFLTIMLILLLAAGFFLPDKVKTRGTTFVNLTTLVRLELWEKGINMFKSSPITGVGLGMFENLMHKPEYELALDKPIIHAHAHNTFVEILAEMGLIGFCAFVYIFVAFFIIFFKFISRSFENFNEAVLFGLAGSIFANLVLALGSSIIVVGLQDAVIFWLIFGMAMGIMQSEYIS
jgi:O-antigen ligase